MLGDRIRQLREERRMTQSDLAAYLGLTPKAVSFFELNQREPSRETLVKLSRKFNVTIDSLLDNSVDPVPKGVRIPILGKVAAGIPLEAITDILGYEEISAKLARSGEYFALMVKGESMAPAICDGSIVIVRKQEYVEHRQLAVVLVNGNEVTIKEVHLVPTGGIMLVAWNASVYTPQFYSAADIARLPVRILGRVVENRRKF